MCPSLELLSLHQYQLRRRRHGEVFCVYFGTENQGLSPFPQQHTLSIHNISEKARVLQQTPPYCCRLLVLAAWITQIYKILTDAQPSVLVLDVLRPTGVKSCPILPFVRTQTRRELLYRPSAKLPATGHRVHFGHTIFPSTSPRYPVKNLFRLPTLNIILLNQSKTAPISLKKRFISRRDP